MAFGEKVWYKELRFGKDRKNKFEGEWPEGLWLGRNCASNEAIIGTKEGVIRAYAIKRKTEEERWDSKLIKNVKGTPQKATPARKFHRLRRQRKANQKNEEHTGHAEQVWLH